jgi:hypothetical protein
LETERLPAARICDILREGTVIAERGALPGYNASFLIELQAEGTPPCLAVYKPRRGESHLWDFPTGTLYLRECLAYRVSERLGWAIVPPTVVREGPHGIGSVQLFIRAQQGKHFFNLWEEHKDAMVRMAIFDCLINNADRKGGHVLRDAAGHIWGIDHGLAFSAEPKLRTVMWDLEDEPVTQAHKDAIRAFTQDSALRSELEARLSPGEAATVCERAAIILSAQKVPLSRFADSWRPYPWPPI